MGKLLDGLNKQLSTEYKQDAEDCMKIYNYLKQTTGKVWQSEWTVLVQAIFSPYPSYEKRYKPTVIGYTLIKGIDR